MTERETETGQYTEESVPDTGLRLRHIVALRSKNSQFWWGANPFFCYGVHRIAFLCPKIKPGILITENS